MNMLHEVFYWLLNMSMIGTAFGLLLYLLRLVKGFPKFMRYALWGVVLVRLICPIGISSSYSLLSLVSGLFKKVFVKTVTLGQSADGQGIIPDLTVSNAIRAASEYNPVSYKTDALEGFFKAASVVWIIVALASIIAAVLMYMLAKSELRKAVHIEGNLYEGSMVSTPSVYGIIRPRIIIPLEMDKSCLDKVLLHEQIHIKRRDNIWHMAAILTACLHWFNPFIWLFLKSFLNDCELACDEKAVKGMNTEEKKEYALALLSCAAMEKTVFTSAFGSSRIKVRIKNVLSYKKLTVFSSFCFMVMFIIIVFILLTNATV